MIRIRFIAMTAAALLLLVSCGKENTDPAISTANTESYHEEDEHMSVDNKATPDMTYEQISQDTADDKEQEDTVLEITANGITMSAVFENNSSAEAFKELLKEGSLTILMSDYGNFEKVGDLGTSLPRNDEQITTEPGDIILYQGNKVTIYYDTNSWNFTRMAKIVKTDSDKSMKEILGEGDVEVTFALVEICK